MSLRDAVNDELMAELQQRAGHDFPGLSFKAMMEFLLSDGIMPESGLPVRSLIELEDWVRARAGQSAAKP